MKKGDMKKKILEIHQNFDNDTINIIKNLLMKQIKQYQRKSLS